MLVLWRGVVQVLRGNNEDSKEDTVSCARHALGCRGKSSAKTLEVNEGAKKGRNLNIALLDENGDEGFKRRKSWVWRLTSGLEVLLGGCCWWRWQASGCGRSTLNDIVGLRGKISCDDGLH